MRKCRDFWTTSQYFCDTPQDFHFPALLSRPSAPPPREGGWRSNGSFTKSPLEAKILRFSLISINSTAVFGGAKIQWNLQQETVRSEDSKLFLWFRSISLLSLEGGEDPMKLASKIRSRRNFWVFRLSSVNVVAIFGGDPMKMATPSQPEMFDFAFWLPIKFHWFVGTGTMIQ